MSEGNVLEVSDADFESEVIRSKVPVLVDFWADWCAPCRMVQPVVEELADELAGRVRVVRIDVDANRETACRYEVVSIPTVMLFSEGQVRRQVIGALPKESLLSELGLGLEEE